MLQISLRMRALKFLRHEQIFAYQLRVARVFLLMKILERGIYDMRMVEI